MSNSKQLVQAAVAAARQQDKTSIGEAFLGFSRAPVDDVLAELCVQLQEVTADCDIDQLMDAVQLPLPDDPMRMLISVWKVDTEALFACADNDAAQLLAKLVVLIAALQEAGERTGILVPPPPKVPSLLSRLFGKTPAGARA